MPAVEELEAEIRDRTVAIDAALERELAGGSPRSLHEAGRHLVRAGGKRLRPGLLLLAAEAVDPNGSLEGRLPAAVAIELVHTLSLIHDDVIDDDDLRRGVPSVHVAWNQSTAIVAGDLLYARAFELVGQTSAPPETRLECTRVLARACQRLCEGQARDLALTHDGPEGEAEYLRTVAEKTGALFAAATEIGARLAGDDAAVAAALARYGESLGMAFQLHDDVLDVTATTDALGKPVGSDLTGGKPTLVTIHARQQGVDVRPQEADADGLECCRARLEDAGSIEYVGREADRHVASALDALEAVPASPARATLGELARFAVRRER